MGRAVPLPHSPFQLYRWNQPPDGQLGWAQEAGSSRCMACLLPTLLLHTPESFSSSCGPDAAAPWFVYTLAATQLGKTCSRGPGSPPQGQSPRGQAVEPFSGGSRATPFILQLSASLSHDAHLTIPAAFQLLVLPQSISCRKEVTGKAFPSILPFC